MSRLKPVIYTEPQRIERRALQAVRAIKGWRSVLSNEVRVTRHVEQLAEADRQFWLTKHLGDVHPSTKSVLGMCAQMDADASAVSSEVAQSGEVAS